MKKDRTLLFGICFALQMVAQEQKLLHKILLFGGDVPDPLSFGLKIHIMLRVPLSEWAPFYPNVYLEGSGKLETGRACFYQANRPGLLIHFWAPELFIIIIKFTVIILPAKKVPGYHISEKHV